MKKLALMTTLITAMVMPAIAMANNGHPHHKTNASNHKYFQYNNGNPNHHKHKVKAKRHAKQPSMYRHTTIKKWPVPQRPTNRNMHAAPHGMMHR